MKNLFIIIPFFILINSCKSVKCDNDFPEYFNEKLYFQIDENFVNEIIPKLQESHFKFLDSEKLSYLSKGLNNANYLNSIDWKYNYFEINNNKEFLQEQISSIIVLRGKHLKIEKLYLFDLIYSGEQILTYNFVIIEDRAGMEIYYFNAQKLNTKALKFPIKKNIYGGDSGVTEAFVDNLRFSFEDVQKMDLRASFSVYKITATNTNKYNIETHIVHDMLASQNIFFEKIYEVRQ